MHIQDKRFAEFFFTQLRQVRRRDQGPDCPWAPARNNSELGSLFQVEPVALA